MVSQNTSIGRAPKFTARVMAVSLAWSCAPVKTAWLAQDPGPQRPSSSAQAAKGPRGWDGYGRCRRTSSESRTASPIILNATTVMIRMIAGGYTSHQ